MTTAEAQKNALQTYLQFVQEVQSEHKFESIKKLVHPDFVDHSPAFGLPPTREGVEIFMRSLIHGFPDLSVEIAMQAVNGDKVWTRKWFTGTHLGTFSGIEPTKKEVGKIFDQYCTDVFA